LGLLWWPANHLPVGLCSLREAVQNVMPDPTPPPETNVEALAATTDEDKIAQRDYWLATLYHPEGVRVWVAHAETQGWSLDYQLERLEQLVTGAYA